MTSNLFRAVFPVTASPWHTCNTQCKKHVISYVLLGDCYLLFNPVIPGGTGSLVGIANGYGLDGPGIESRREATFSVPVHNGPGPHPASCTMSTGTFLGVKSGQDVTLTPHPLLVPWSWNGRAIPLLPLWAVRPVQSLSACTRGALYLLPEIPASV